MYPQQAYETLQCGIDRGELPVGSKIDLVLDSLYGPIYMRFLIRHDKLDESFADEICALVLQGLKSAASPRMGTPLRKLRADNLHNAEEWREVLRQADTY